MREDPRKDKEALHEGDIVTIKAFNGQYLEVDSDGGVNAGRKALGGPGANAKPVFTRDFVVHKMGVSTITRHNNCIRRGDKICLKPVVSSEEKNNDYLKLNDHEDGLEAKGTIFDREIGFVVEAQTIQPVVQPLQRALELGDVSIAFAPLWDKQNIQHREAMSAAWCTEAELAKVQGIVVVAAGGQYSVPKAQGGGPSDWVAVVDDGVDLFKAAKQAKAQGATGIIVRCDNPCSLDRLMLGADESKERPCLPVVFASKENAEALNERGLTLKGISFKKRYVTDVMRAIGKAPITKGKQANVDVFNAAAAAMLEREKELRAWKEAEEERARMQAMRETQEAEGEGEGGGEQGQFKWKVNTNTHYLWGGKGQMKVNFGSKAPPSAGKQKIGADGKVAGVDAGTLRQTVKRNSLNKPKKKVRVSVITIESQDFKDKKIGGGRDQELFADLGEILTAEEAQNQPMEELSEESDFRIEYKFDEIMVDADVKAEDVEDQELVDDSGVEIQTLGVPKKKFWIVATGLGFSTLLLLIILIAVLSKKKEEKQQVSEEDQKGDIYSGDASIFTRFHRKSDDFGKIATTVTESLMRHMDPLAQADAQVLSGSRTVASTFSSLDGERFV
eukprot:SRR837773.11274.p1 GENE.SRR837773.11274~~SRR837773.11274.p1  ORF type:complete len:656 (-),score=184.07 SRR837773.11274:33-1883(-)